MQVRERGDTISATFQTIRLPRPAKIHYPREEEDLVASWGQCDLFLMAREGNLTCGYITVQTLAGHGLACIQDLVVDAPHRRQGIGTGLLREAAIWARQQQLRRLIVAVQTNNYPAICFCRSMGLILSGYNDQHWRTQDIALLFAQNLH
jgi:ribosomal protein S18 acetylase RimI-like enzyme